MTIDTMKRIKKEKGYSLKTLSRLSGVPVSTIQKILSGTTDSPRQDTLEALEKALSSNVEDKLDTSYDSPESLNDSFNKGTYTPIESYGYPEEESTMVCESLVYKTDGSYTLDDYLALPDDQRVELIDGVFYEMAAPTTHHQAIAGYIYKQLLDFVLEHKGPCYPFISPVDVQLDRDDKTVVQPDVLIVCDRDKYQNGRVFGAPDFIVEVLSPSTKKKDMLLKLYKYANAGVHEYWMIDYKAKRIIQYDLENIDFPVLYSFEDTVPVLIWDKKCVVDFKDMFSNISFLWDR